MKKITVVILFYCSFASAEGFRLLTKPWEASTTANFKNNKGESDTRVDTNSDGVVDAIRVQDGNTTTDIYYIEENINFKSELRENGQSTIAAGKIVNGVAQVTDTAVIDTSKSRESNAETASDRKQICNKITENLKKYKAVDVQSMADSQKLRACESAFHDSCFEDSFNAATYNSELIQLLRDTPDSKVGIGCLSKIVNNARQEFKQNKGTEETLLRLELALSEARAEAANLLSGSQQDIIFQCVVAEDAVSTLQSDRSIKVTQPDNKKPASISSAMFKRWGVPGNVESALAFCAKGKSEYAANLKAKALTTQNLSSNLKVLDPTAVKEVVEGKYAPTQKAPIEKNLAQTKVTIPSATEASPKALAKIEATQGPAAVQQVMQQQRSGILNMTNAVMAAVNTQAVAGTKTATRSVASAGSGSGSGSSSSKSSSISGLKKTTIGKNEKIVEEYTVDEPRSGAKTRAVANVGTQGAKSAASLAAAATGNSRKPANVDEATGGSGELAGGTGGGGGGGSAGGAGRGSSFSPSSGGTKNNSAAAAAGGQGRNTASASSANTNDEISGDELVSFIKNSEYASTKLKIQKDNKFRNQLKVNGITIIDKAGNFIVPGDNKVIFMDKGNRFEKQ